MQHTYKIRTRSEKVKVSILYLFGIIFPLFFYRTFFRLVVFLNSAYLFKKKCYIKNICERKKQIENLLCTLTNEIKI